MNSPSVPDTSAKPLSSESEYCHAPVTGLRLVNAGRLYLFDDLGVGDEPVQLLTVGRHRRNDIVIRSKSTSRVHCIIERRGKFWTIADPYSSNHTLVHHEQTPYAIRVEKAPLVLSLNMRIILPDEILYPVTESGKLAIVAFDQHDLRIKAHHLYGSTRQAGKHLGVSHTTISDALKAKKNRQKNGSWCKVCSNRQPSPKGGESKGKR